MATVTVKQKAVDLVISFKNRAELLAFKGVCTYYYQVAKVVTDNTGDKPQGELIKEILQEAWDKIDSAGA